jgi:hypothetical protein
MRREGEKGTRAGAPRSGAVTGGDALGLDVGDVLAAAGVAARGKRRSPDVAAFLIDAEASSLRLLDELCNGQWRPSRPRRFWIHEPKPRLLSALPFGDRVVQHLLIGATLSMLERCSAPQSYACRRGMGTHRCLRAAASWMRARGWVLRLDISIISWARGSASAASFATATTSSYSMTIRGGCGGPGSM